MRPAAQLAYETYIKYMGGVRTPSWLDLSPYEREAWAAVAQVLDQRRPGL